MGGSVLVTGGSIAGPAQAWALSRAGYDVTLLERAAAPREAGQNIDIRDAGHDVLRAMGVREEVAANTTGEIGLRYRDPAGRAYADLPTTEGRDGPTAELEILRGRFSEILRRLTTDDPRVEHSYGDSIADLSQDDHGVDVRFAGGGVEHFDLVVVAEGRNSTTRDLVLGDAVTRVSRDQYIAYGTIPRTADDDDWWNWMTTTDSRMVSTRPDDVGTIRANLSFVAPDLAIDKIGHAAQMTVLRARFAGVGWATDRILDGFAAAPDEFYMERMDKVALSVYSRGRVIVVGDAAWAAGPTGMGTTLALVGAYVLAGELDRARSGSGVDHTRAYEGYESVIRPYAEAVQTLPPGGPRVVLPRSERALAVQRAVHRVLATPAVRDRVEKRLVSRAGGDFRLPRYPLFD
ncbi:FAD-dependent monooxygenase [Williamsia serinedens]|uniref:2-polyprenyl-6-methoxyphenol hydroxylase n=1 Tax=Williamsia serinedens TaxID=391736 RepID=A0ABT1H2M0_9NOCA|nr:FAD-dependent monooxygenase [Williamsia serinedens]MCP2160072.1 2-polyprenyl-6-methoxyphenol hydroxylase [Williamsia serinedens]